ncbi:MAG: hypothetical protein QGG40_22245, partial [Myxococcota bacterium]|nr:hypothetical protein [Myxococcota bacterium]
AGSGYNFPRHAGTAWFLARLAVRTGDAEFLEGASRALDFVERNTTRGPQGAYFRDPARDDGKVWAGTTALASLAAALLDHPLAGEWGAYLAASVDERGQVRGNAELEGATGLAFPEQPQNPYGQGQTTLALASLVRAGHEELKPALVRAADFLDGDYAPLAGGRLLVLDEHWTCLAALATREVLGRAAGMEVCRAYLDSQASRAPRRGSALQPTVAAAGGLAEAVVAAAVLDPDGPYLERAVDYGWLFLRSAYQEGDRPFLGSPTRLLGGFRDRVSKLDVQIDTVQHVGCALLGVEALLSETLAGSLP